ncbi:Tyrosine recombinase XerC [Arenibacter antarcticus]|uniref:Tyrosine-type recombinase/integrase n=1 Tax=Arenibacter antarcticus TaxID=2040469 RepID=A0ABW5VG36_9FLAO|nr:tyrosine-type recombinase/integrase [Arenibacter sp. H213]MCM4169812.1 integrase [Arenibacter sp. H213]
MAIFEKLITLNNQVEHDLDNVLSHNDNYSIPKIYDAKGDLSKRWYVYFSFRNTETNKMERISNIYGKAHKYKTKENRYAILSSYRINLLKHLKEGYNPFDSNRSLHNSVKEQKNPTKSESNFITATKEADIIVSKDTPAGTALKDAFDFSLKLKKQQVSERTFQDYKYKMESFLKYISKHHTDVKTIDQLSKNVTQDFLNNLLLNSSPRNRNNHRLAMGSVMQTLEDNDIMPVNFIKKIPVLKSTPQRNKTYTLDKENKIFDYLESEDPILLLFIKFISYNFLRPIEVCRIRIGDINLENNTIQFKAKNSPLKTKIIPEILLKELPDLTKMDKTHFLFTPDKIGGVWETQETNKRNYFSKCFKTIVKAKFDLGADYGLYSFRHTYITKLYRMLLKNGSPFEAKSKLMLITGHTSMSALEKYLRDIDAELPEDYSHLLE